MKTYYLYLDGSTITIGDALRGELLKEFKAKSYRHALATYSFALSHGGDTFYAKTLQGAGGKEYRAEGLIKTELQDSIGKEFYYLG